MQIRIRTLQKDTFSVTVPTGATVAQLKEAIKQEKGHEISWQKIIYSGKILQDDKTLESYSVNENDFCVLMIKKPKEDEAPKQETKPVEQPKKEEPKKEEPKKEEPKTAPTTVTETPKQTETTPQEGEKKDFSSQAASQLATNKEEVERLLTQLVEMGFPKEQAAKALRASFNNLSRAVEYLMSGEIPNTFEVPPVGGGLGVGGGTGLRPPTSPSTTPTAGTGTSTSGASSPSTSGSAGTSTSGGSNPINLWEAAQQQGEQQQGGGGGVFDFLRGNREFNTLRFMVQQNPQMLQPILQSLGQANPGLLQLITQNQEEFTRLLYEPVDPSQIALPRQPQTVQLNEEERAALNRLMDLGFTQQAALEAYLTCEKNEELAANYLLEHAAEYMQDEAEGEFEGGEGEGGEGEGEGGDFGGTDN